MKRVTRWLCILVALGAVGWSGWWYLGARGQEAGIQAWLDKQRKRGWTVETAPVAVEGYPLDFRLSVGKLALSDPRRGWSWSAPMLSAASRSYEPTRIIVTWPDEQVFEGGGDRAQVTSEKAETILDLRPGPSMELRQAATRIENLRITAERGGQSGARSVNVDLVESEPGTAADNSYNLTVDAASLELPGFVLSKIDPTGRLDPLIDRFSIQAFATFRDALGRHTMEKGDVALRAAKITTAGFEWGKMRLTVSGEFTVNAEGYPEGSIQVEAHEWGQMVSLAVQARVIDQSTAKSVTKAINFINGLAGGRKELRAPLTLTGGKIKLGPFNIADAPRLAEKK